MFKRIVKIPKKSFEDLTLPEVASMVEADSAFGPNGNRDFDACALDEFLHCFKPKRDDLKEIQSRILANIYLDRPGSEQKDINREYLEATARKLRQGELPDI